MIIDRPIPDRLDRPAMVRAFDMDPGSLFAPHSHDWGQLAYASAGVLVVSTRSGTWTVPPARAVWIPPGIEHAINCLQGGAAFRSVYVRAEQAITLGAECRVLKVTNLLRELILSAVDCPIDYDKNGADGRLMQVMLDQIHNLGEEAPLHLPMPEDRRLNQLARLLIEDPGNVETLPALARKVGASKRTIARHFVDETGLTFGEWRRRLRLVTAVERLSAGRPVTEVALDLGYESPSSFSAMFRKALGQTPRDYMPG